MNILMVAVAFDLSGQTIHIRNLARGLIARGHTVAVAAGNVAARRPLGRECFDAVGVPVFKIDVANFGAGIPVFAAQMLASARSLRCLLESFRPDIVNVHALTLLPQTQLARVMTEPMPAIVSTFHNEEIDSRKRKAGRFACRLSPIALGHRVLAISAAMRRMIVDDIGVNESTVRVISNAADDSYFVPPMTPERDDARRQFNIAADEVAIVCLARMEPRKNQATLIHAIAQLRNKGLPLRLVLMGDDINGYRKELEKMVTDLEARAFVGFHGFHSDPRKLFWAADINALISFREGFGLVVIEAGMTGVVSIRSRSAGAEDQIVNQTTGLLVDAQDVDSVCGAIETLVRFPERRKTMGRLAEASCRGRYSIGTMAQQVETAYTEAIARSRWGR